MRIARGVLKLLGGLVALLLAVIIIVANVLLPTERTVFDRAVSPNGWTEARVQFDDCGATCGFEKQVLVRSRWFPIDNPWLSCRAFLGQGQAKVRLSWLDNSTLLVEHHFAPKSIVETVKRCGSTNIIEKPVQPFEAYS